MSVRKVDDMCFVSASGGDKTQIIGGENSQIPKIVPIISGSGQFSVSFNGFNNNCLMCPQTRIIFNHSNKSLMFDKLFLLILVLQSMIAISQPKYVAHRGASWLAPENTMASIELAWQLDSYAAECDIMLTKDGQVVLFHDKNSLRLTGKSHDVSKTDYSVLGGLEIKLRNTNSPHFTGQKIPLLKDVLDRLPDGRLLVIEIKTGTEILSALEQVIKSHWKKGKIAFISFGYEVVCEVKKMYPDVPAFYLSGNKNDVMDKFEDIKKNKLDGVDMNHKAIDQEVVDKFHGSDMEVWCYTINEVVDARKMADLGVDAITTDRPYVLKTSMEQK